MNRKKRLTAFTFEKVSFRSFSIGDICKVEKNPQNKFDEKALEVTLPDGITKGYIGNKDHTVLDTCVKGVEVYDELPDKFEVVIKEFHPGAIRNRTAVVVETISPQDKLKKLSDKLKNEEYILPFKGTYKKHPNKSVVMELIQNGSTPKVTLKVENDEVIAYYDGESIGHLNESSLDVETISTIKTVVSNNTEMLGVANELGENSRIKDILVKLVVSKEEKNSSNNGNNKSIDAMIEEIVQNGITTKEKCEQVLDYLKKNSVNEKIISKVFNSYKKYPKDLEMLIPNPNSFYDDYLGLVKKNLLYMNINKHLRIVGEKGTGKNKLIETLAWIYNRPLLKLSISREVDKLDLLGSQKLEDGNVVFEAGIVPIAMEYGCILNLDEINTANPGLLTILHSATDWSATITVPGYKTIKADKNFCLIATMNEDYNGTTDLNQATKDRLTTIRVPYPDKISKVLRSQVETDDIVFDICDSIFEQIHNGVQDSKLSADCLTVRGFLSAIEVYNEGLDLQEALIDNVVNNIDDSIERGHVLEAIDLACN